MTEVMATKKGIILTAVILGAITAASFSLWFIPQHENSGPFISDYRNELESIKERHSIIINETSDELNNMLGGTLSPDDFITRAQTSSSQVDSLLSEIIESRAPQEWRDSYLNYGEALKKYNDYLTETIVIANKVKDNVSSSDLQSELQKLDSMKKEFQSLAIKVNETNP
jgi:ABC-type antimicrobial peptide transport system permease subunit